MKRLLAVLFAMSVFGCTTVQVGETGGKAKAGSVVVCHKGKKTLNLPPEAVQAHLDHGDHLGSCK